MEPSVNYRAEQDDLYYPCKRGKFFEHGQSASDAALCAEMARLAYCKQESSFAFDREKIVDNLNRTGFTKCQFRESRDFAHCGKPYYVNRQRKVEFNPNCLTIWLDRFRACTEYLEKYTWLLGKVLVRELADHAPSNYVWAVMLDQS